MSDVSALVLDFRQLIDRIADVRGRKGRDYIRSLPGGGMLDAIDRAAGDGNLDAGAEFLEWRPHHRDGTPWGGRRRVSEDPTS